MSLFCCLILLLSLRVYLYLGAVFASVMFLYCFWLFVVAYCVLCCFAFVLLLLFVVFSLSSVCLFLLPCLMLYVFDVFRVFIFRFS